MQDLTPNAIFKSPVARDCNHSPLVAHGSGSKSLKASGDFNATYQSGQTQMRTTIQKGQMTTTGNMTLHDKSSFGLFNESQY